MRIIKYIGLFMWLSLVGIVPAVVGSIIVYGTVDPEGITKVLEEKAIASANRKASTPEVSTEPVTEEVAVAPLPKVDNSTMHAYQFGTGNLSPNAGFEIVKETNSKIVSFASALEESSVTYSLKAGTKTPEMKACLTLSTGLAKQNCVLRNSKLSTVEYLITDDMLNAGIDGFGPFAHAPITGLNQVINGEGESITFTVESKGVIADVTLYASIDSSVVDRLKAKANKPDGFYNILSRLAESDNDHNPYLEIQFETPIK